MNASIISIICLHSLYMYSAVLENIVYVLIKSDEVGRKTTSHTIFKLRDLLKPIHIAYLTLHISGINVM